MNDDIDPQLKAEAEALLNKVQQLERNNLGFNGQEVLAHMTRTGIQDPMEAFRDLNGMSELPTLNDETPATEGELDDLVRNELYNNNSSISEVTPDNLDAKMREAFGESTDSSTPYTVRPLEENQE